MKTFAIGTGKAGALSLAIGLAIAGCSSLPDRVDTLEQARNSVRSLENDPLAREAASVELGEARQAIAAADRAYEDKEDLEIVEHHAYLAERHAQIAEQQIDKAHADEELADAEARRNEVLLEAREREARRAEAQANAAVLAAELQSERAESAERQASAAEAQAQALAEDLQDLKAEQTERGLVLTLGDILFDTDRAELKPGAAATIDELAAFLNENPERNVRIEGYADARGPETYNRDLSLRRADAVERALTARGVQIDRVATVGLGEEYPVASNETQAGMQENRRVEIVLSDAEGRFPAAALERTAAR